MIWRWELVPQGWALVAASTILLASCYPYANAKFKTSDFYSIGFPAIWSFLVWYLVVPGAGQITTLVIVLACVVLTFTSTAYVHPFRVAFLRPLLLAASILWAAAWVTWGPGATTSPLHWQDAGPVHGFLLPFRFGQRDATISGGLSVVSAREESWVDGATRLPAVSDTFGRARLGLDYQLNPRVRLEFGGSYEGIEASDSGSDTDRYNLTFGLRSTFQVSPRGYPNKRDPALVPSPIYPALK